jgi:hypothetical protein
MNRRTPILATAAAVLITAFGIAPAADAAVPDITGLSAAPSTIYPLINNATRPGFSTITISGNDPATVVDLEVRNAGSVKVRDIFPGGQSTATWDGRDASNHVVPAGVYTVFAIGSGSDVSPFTTTITVSTKKLVLKTFTRTVTAASTLIDRFVGKCSTLRKPSKRGWKGSLGYYSNTKCKSRLFNKAGVLAVHALRVPLAEKYVDVRVNLYGGAAKANKKSRGILLYLDKTQQNAYRSAVASSKLGIHRGKVRAGANMVASNGRFVWSFSTAAPKSKYDVKNFTVVVRYFVLG